MADFIFRLRVLRFLLLDAWRQWVTEVWDRDLDSHYCCDGRECGCGATTTRELWDWQARRGA